LINIIVDIALASMAFIASSSKSHHFSNPEQRSHAEGERKRK
jgi:hypothetical protein